MKTLLPIITLMFMCMLAVTAHAGGDLSRQEPIEIVVELGQADSDAHVFTPAHLVFETGKLYKLVLTNVSQTKHYFTSLKLPDMIFTRKVQVVEDVDGKTRRVAEIKGAIRDIEVFPGHRAEWWFVPIQTGEIKDLHCHVKDKGTGKTHAELGMVGSITIK